ncbi:2128_t:CDS:2 [Ambispora leptoticha]|uniref:2128_t:CDS:1 n=1 Tax=Ambispora leptoticha TaxID=144679 RepID=A0A9N8VY29_9GLOM|nr:2128_t:CDS:2 [Ambispora leptoticha]
MKQERERAKDNIPQPPPHHPSRHQQPMLNGSSSINNVDHHHTITNSPTQMVNHSEPPPPSQVNGGPTMYGSGSRMETYLAPPAAVNPTVYSPHNESAVHRRASEPVQPQNSNPIPVATRGHSYSSHHQINNNPPQSSNVLPQQVPPPPLPPSNSRHQNIHSRNSSPNLHPINSPSAHPSRTHTMSEIRAAMPEPLSNNRQSTAGGGHINQSPSSSHGPYNISHGAPPHSSYNKTGGSSSIPHSPSMGPVITPRAPPSVQTNHYQPPPPSQPSSNGTPRLPSVGLSSHHHPHLSETGVNGNPPQPSPIGMSREPYLRDQAGYVGNGHPSHHLSPNIPHPGPPVGAGVGPGNGPIQRGGGGPNAYYH